MGLRARHAGVDSQRVGSRQTRQGRHRHRNRWTRPPAHELQAEPPTASGGCPRGPDGCIPRRRDPVVLANRHDRPVRRVIPGTEPACLGGGIPQRSGRRRRGPAVLEDRQVHYRSAVGPPGRRPGVYRIASIRVLRGSDVLSPVWRREYRVPVAPRRIDVAKAAPPATNPVASDYTVAMWYFAAWEPEYTWDGWRQVAERSPWRIPLLFDSSDKEMSYNGTQFYRASNRRVVDWHVHWMREHCVNLMLWDWYPGRHPDGTFDPTFFGNRAWRSASWERRSWAGRRWPRIGLRQPCRSPSCGPITLRRTVSAGAWRNTSSTSSSCSRTTTRSTAKRSSRSGRLATSSPAPAARHRPRRLWTSFDSTPAVAAYRASTWSPSTGAFARANREAGDRWGHGLRGAACRRLDDRIPARG